MRWRQRLVVGGLAAALALLVLLPRAGGVAADDGSGSGERGEAREARSEGREGRGVVAVAVAFEAGWNAQNVEQVLGLFADDAAIDVPPSGCCASLTGGSRDALRAWVLTEMISHPHLLGGSAQVVANRVTWQYSESAERWRRLGIDPEEGLIGIVVAQGQVRAVTAGPTLRWAARRDSAYAEATRVSAWATATVAAQVQATASARSTAAAALWMPGAPNTQGRAHPSAVFWPLAGVGGLVAAALAARRR